MIAGDGTRPARVSSVYGTLVEVWLPEGTQRAVVRGRAQRDAPIEGGIAVGDWVAVAPAAEGSDEVVVKRVLPRRTAFVRQAAGERSEPQAIAANIDRVLVVASLEGEFRPRSIERYLIAIAASGAEATIVLNKADLCADPTELLALASSLAPTVLCSARTDLGYGDLRALMARGTTVALVGSSGVGKSALVNGLLGRTAQTVGEVRYQDKRGRHTTTRRSLLAVPGGGLLVDTPGMRELKPWQPGESDGAETASTFADIVALGESCKYRDCGHVAEPGCAIRAGVKAGALDAGRVASWEKLALDRTRRQGRQAAFAAVQERRRARSASVSLSKRRTDNRGR